MQLVRFQYVNSEHPNSGLSWGVRVDERLFDLGQQASYILATQLIVSSEKTRIVPDESLKWSLAHWELARPAIEQLIDRLPPVAAETRLLCPVPGGGRLFCIGLNYRDHALESGMEIPSEPVVFCKLPGALCGPDCEVQLPKISHKVDYEAELVLVIGKPAWNCDETEAAEAIFGYSCGHDVSARDWQLGRPGGQWLLGKSFPNFAPVGPWLVPREEIADVCSLSIALRLNGETLQSSTTSQLIYQPATLVSYLAQFFQLEPGDLIFTGTPPGVGMARTPPRFLQSGDQCEIEIEGIGVLRNTFVR